MIKQYRNDIANKIRLCMCDNIPTNIFVGQERGTMNNLYITNALLEYLTDEESGKSTLATVREYSTSLTNANLRLWDMAGVKNVYHECRDNCTFEYHDRAYVAMYHVSDEGLYTVDHNGVMINALQIAAVSARKAAYGNYNRTIKINGNDLVVPNGTKIRRVKKAVKSVSFVQHGATAYNLRCIRAAELTAAYAAVYSTPIHMLTTEYVVSKVQSLSSDCAELVSVAMERLLSEYDESRGTHYDMIHSAYLAINHYLKNERQSFIRELSIEYVQDCGGDLIAVNDAMHAIIFDGMPLTATVSNNMDSATSKRLGETLVRAMRELTKPQRQIAFLLGKGYSSVQIAERMKRNQSTIADHIAKIRVKMAAVIEGTEFNSIVKSAEINAANKAVNARKNQRSAESLAYAKATQAARAKAYRERKKAAAMAAKGE